MHSLKFLEEYSDQQSQIWKIFHKHHTIPEDLQDLHFHFDDFKTSLEKDLKYLKEATLQNICHDTGMEEGPKVTLDISWHPWVGG